MVLKLISTGLDNEVYHVVGTPLVAFNAGDFS